MGRTTIAWTFFTLNLVWGCTKVSAECDYCYMFRLSYRFGKNPEVVAIMYQRTYPIYNQIAQKMQFLNLEPARKKLRALPPGSKVFINSMSDTFHESIPFHIIDEWFELFKEFPNLQFQILTKRTNRMRKYFETRECPANVWLGTSVGDRWHTFRIKTLQRTRTKGIRFISFEPLLGNIGQVDLMDIHWIIVGGESDYEKPRPMSPDWAEDLRVQAGKQGVAYFFKQMGGKGGNNAGGEELNGIEYKAFPTLP